MAMIQPAPNAVCMLVNDIMQEYHTELHNARVRVDVYMALPDLDKDGETMDRPALTDKGYACLAKIKINGSDDRGKGRGHAEMTIDHERYSELTERQRQAVIDHELMHLDVCYDKDDEIVEDKYGMTKLRMRKHDHQYGWFNDVADRWDKDSQEVIQAVQLLNGRSNSAGWIQIALDFGESDIEKAAREQGLEITGRDANGINFRDQEGTEMRLDVPDA